MIVALIKMQMKVMAIIVVSSHDIQTVRDVISEKPDLVGLDVANVIKLPL